MDTEHPAAQSHGAGSASQAPAQRATPLPPAAADNRAAIEATLAALPAEPGCYLFRDAGGTVLYVGKARSLRDRVRSYFRNPGSLSIKNRGLVPRIASIDYQILPSENAALLVESNLIKQYRPKYNIVLRDDKSYLAIRITDEPYPRIEPVRRRSDDGARYFGPYTSAQSVYRTLDLVKRLFPYRSCRLQIVPPEGAQSVVAQAASAPAPAPGRRPPRRGGHADAEGNSRRPPQERTRVVANPEYRACLEYHIHRCSAPCIDNISQPDYARIIDQAALLLQGKSEQIVVQLEHQMEEAAEALDFERAARLRDQLEAVRRVTERQRVTIIGGHDQDIVGLARLNDETCVELLAVREGKMLGHRQFLLLGTAEQEDAEVLGAFLTQYYPGAPEVPEELLLPTEPADLDTIGPWLNGLRGRKVTLTVPRRGDKVALVEVAQQNARDAAEQRTRAVQADSQKTAEALTDLQRALGLPRLPMRIECYDISNIQGTSAVGSMVVFENGKPKNAAYRRFRIRTVQGSDDFAMMAEMVRRRLKRAGAVPTGDVGDANQGDTELQGADGAELEVAATQAADGVEGAEAQAGLLDSEWTRRPDLMLIDGGKGQLNAVLAVLVELGVTDQPLASLAKQQEELFLPGRPDSILLPRNAQALFLVQRIRDEAHRFAITYHRSVRGKGSLESSLDSVPGVGGRRKRDLIRQFGSVAALRRASLEEIAAVPGIGPKTALTIKEHLGDA